MPTLLNTTVPLVLHVSHQVHGHGCGNYNVDATIEDDSCEHPLSEFVDREGAWLNDGDADGVCDESEIPGCTDETACNYDANATDLDDFVTSPRVGESTDASACNYDDSATVEDGFVFSHHSDLRVTARASTVLLTTCCGRW